MHSLFKTEISGNNGHPSEDELLLYVDGELTQKATNSIRTHLEACWSCRVRTEQIQETISSFINYRNTILRPRIEPPPHAWRGFDGRLRQIALESGKRTPLSRLFGHLKRCFSYQHLIGMPHSMLRIAAMLLIAIGIATLVIRFKKEPIVSANELLRQAVDAETTQIKATNQTVVHQRIQVRLKEQSSSREESVNLEIWHDTANSRFRRSLIEGEVRRFIPTTNDSRSIANDPSQGLFVPAVLSEVEQVLNDNHMDPQRLLSPVSFETWRNSLDQKNDYVTRTRLPNGLDALTLRTVPMGYIGVGKIAEVALVVRAGDWHPVEQRLLVKGLGGDKVYELNETSFEVVSLTAVGPEIFADPMQVASPPHPSITPRAIPSPVLADNRQPLPLMPMLPIASIDLEIEALRLLNQAGADLGEQINVTRDRNGLLWIKGIVETDDRKIQIQHALQPLINDPAVRVEIQTVAEAVAKQAGQTKRRAEPLVEEKVEINSGSIATEYELRRYFSDNEQLTQFAARMVAGSRQALQHVAAMKRLVAQFSEEELRTLTPETRGKWLALIRSHAHSYQTDAAGLRSELQPIFFPGTPPTSVEGGAEIIDDASMTRAVNQLFELASANDRVIRSAFVASTEAATITAITTPQFWQSLSNAEALAARLQSAK